MKRLKIGLGPREDLELVEIVRKSIGDDVKLMVDANHAYTAREAIPLGTVKSRMRAALARLRISLNRGNP